MVSDRRRRRWWWFDFFSWTSKCCQRTPPKKVEHPKERCFFQKQKSWQPYITSNMQPTVVSVVFFDIAFGRFDPKRLQKTGSHARSSGSWNHVPSSGVSLGKVNKWNHLPTNQPANHVLNKQFLGCNSPNVLLHPILTEKTQRISTLETFISYKI